jgi:chromosome partitioning protein
MTKVVSFNATKGGTGKTTLSIITINVMAALGFKCLAIDTDMINHSLSFYYNTGISFDTIQANNIFKVFAGESIKDNIIPITDRLDLLHADVRLSDFRSIDNCKRLKKKIQELTGYDYIVIDTAPTFDNIIANVFHASDYLIIPVIPDVFNFQSVKYLFGKLSDLELSDLDTHVVFNQYDKPRSDNKDIFSNQVIDLFRSDEAISPFICKTSIAKSSIIKKYINDRSYKINKRQETAKQFAEIKDFLYATLAITMNTGGI